MIDLEAVKSQLDYDPNTGIFRWKVAKNGAGGNRLGKVAGCLIREGVRSIVINHEPYRAHRLAWFYVHGEWPQQRLKHIDGNLDNNAINNLREIA